MAVFADIDLPSMPSPIKAFDFDSPMATLDDSNVSLTRHLNLQDTLKNLQQQVQAYKAGTKNMVKAAKALEADNSKLRSKYAAKKRELRRLLGKLNEREAELGTLRKKVVDLEAVLAADADADETETESADESGDGSAILVTPPIEVAAELASALEARDAAEAELAAIKAQLAEAETTAGELAAEVAAREALEHQLAQEQRKVYSMSRNSCLLSDQLSAAKAEIASQSQLLENIRSREGEDDGAGRAVALAEAEAKVAELSAQLEATTADAGALAERLAETQKQLAAAEDAAAEFSIQLALPNKEQSEQIASLEDTLSRTSAELEATHDALAASELRASKLEGELELVITRIRDLHDEQASMEREFAFTEAEHLAAVVSADSAGFIRGALVASSLTTIVASAVAALFFFRRRRA
ncbi:uncharacterized protein AMSG_07013 [Thecamonas trahens ATCC 50062]|uniref:Uncharacterized protein n=1 Tax=Thecamonas trahens ATCC 50062 TaxID=461836 RepID=A0A0L0DFM1_THETB|nr:hypothetical protein AMSG_07013 [Thecamonas trahens ATCC 50062]KNC51035.1 hypothetical protein AMSG_07013 [Thecamonas trahens ATCC 50062]|eukprot:XP_013756502.1 hypothetical protein AMSG_07013 [Thecamonas trahens ATCC 50062]